MKAKNNKGYFSEGSLDLSESLEEKLEKVLNKVPDVFRNLIDEGFIHKRIPKEYTLSSILFAISSAVGKHFYMEELGYKNYANCYFIIVGSRGDAKSEAINLARKPIVDYDNKNYKNYLEELEGCGEDDLPIRIQLIIQNATIEKAQHVHYQNLSGIGVYFDEVRPIIQKMNNPNSRDGLEWLVFFLEGFTNNVIDISRKTTDSFRIESGYITFIGGIQNQFLNDLHSDSLVASGFNDRLLFTPLITRNSKISDKKMSDEVVSKYDETISNLLAYKLQSEKPEETIRERRLFLTKDAEALLHKYSQRLLDLKEQSSTPLKEYYSKLMIYLHKFCILCFLMKNGEEKTFKSEIDNEDVQFAIELVEFYKNNFIETMRLRDQKDKPNLENIIRLAKKNKASQKVVVDLTGYSKSQVSKYWNKL